MAGGTSHRRPGIEWLAPVIRPFVGHPTRFARRNHYISEKTVTFWALGTTTHTRGLDVDEQYDRVDAGWR